MVYLRILNSMRKQPLQDVIVKTGGARPSRPGGMLHDEFAIRPHTPPPRGFDTPHAVALPPRRESRPEPVRRPLRDEPEDYTPYQEHSETPDTGERRWLFIALAIGAVIIASAVVLSFMFAGASVTAYPKQDTVVVNTTFGATADPVEGMVPFKQIVIERTTTKSVPAQAEQQVEERASGKITVYNAYASSPQRLIKNTRFQSDAGKVFRIRESIEVPGKKSDTDPGSIEVAVYAEEPGVDYNIPAGSFTVPGFAKLPQEGKVYAKSTEAFAGGFKGTRRTVDESSRQAALKELEQQLRDELLAAAFESKDKPEGYYLFKEAVFFEFNALPDEDVSGQDQITLKLTGKIHSMLFPEEAFAKRIATQVISTYAGSAIRLDNPYDLKVTVTPGETAQATREEADDAEIGADAVPAWQATSFNVTVDGKAHFIWDFDEKKLSADLAGKDTGVLDTVKGGLLEAYPGIDRIHATVRPFWKHTFPVKAEDIVVVKELDS